MRILRLLLSLFLGRRGGGLVSNSGALLAVLQAVLASKGGLAGLQELFKQKGLEKVFSGWITTGPNPPISGAQLQNVLGPDLIKQMARQLGMDGPNASNLLARYLPDVIDKLTPNGNIDPQLNLKQGLAELLPSLLGQGQGK